MGHHDRRRGDERRHFLFGQPVAVGQHHRLGLVEQTTVGEKLDSGESPGTVWLTGVLLGLIDMRVDADGDGARRLGDCSNACFRGAFDPVETQPDLDALATLGSQGGDRLEIEAGAEAMRKGVEGGSVSLLAKSAPSGRSLAVPLFVIGSLTDRGLTSDEALQRVLTRLQARASDADLESLPGELPAQGASGQSNRPAETGRDFGQSHKKPKTGRPATAGPPAGVPGNGGVKSNPGQGHKPPKNR